MLRKSLRCYYYSYRRTAWQTGAYISVNIQLGVSIRVFTEVCGVYYNKGCVLVCTDEVQKHSVKSAVEEASSPSFISYLSKHSSSKGHNKRRRGGGCWQRHEAVERPKKRNRRFKGGKEMKRREIASQLLPLSECKLKLIKIPLASQRESSICTDGTGEERASEGQSERSREQRYV